MRYSQLHPELSEPSPVSRLHLAFAATLHSSEVSCLQPHWEGPGLLPPLLIPSLE
jgi:hypothetical protein